MLRLGPRHGFSTIDSGPPASRSARCQGSSATAPAFLGSGRDGRLAGLAPTALARGTIRRGGPGLAPTLLQRLAHPRQVQVAVVLLGDIQLLGRAVRVA